MWITQCSTNHVLYELAFQYSQLSHNGRLVKADTSLKRTRGVGPCRTSVIYFISLQGGHLSKVDTWSWSLIYFSHLLHLPPRETPLEGGQLELVLRVSALEGVDCTAWYWVKQFLGETGEGGLSMHWLDSNPWPLECMPDALLSYKINWEQAMGNLNGEGCSNCLSDWWRPSAKLPISCSWWIL